MMSDYDEHTECDGCGGVFDGDDIMTCTTCNDVYTCADCFEELLNVEREGKPDALADECDLSCAKCFRRHTEGASMDVLGPWYLKMIGVKESDLHEPYRQWMLGNPNPELPVPKPTHKQRRAKTDYLGTVVE